MALLLFAGVASPQELHRTFAVPFHVTNGVILLDATVNGKPAVMLLDTGANVTFFHRSSNDITFEIEPHHFILLHANSLNDLGIKRLIDIEKKFPRIDGILGADALRQFSAVRIDFKNQVVELER